MPKKSSTTSFVTMIRQSPIPGMKRFPDARALERFLALVPQLHQLAFAHNVSHGTGKRLQYWTIRPSNVEGRQWKLSVLTHLTVNKLEDTNEAAWKPLLPAHASSQTFETDLTFSLRLHTSDPAIKSWLVDPHGSGNMVCAMKWVKTTIPFADLTALCSTRLSASMRTLTEISAACPQYTLIELEALGKACPGLQKLELTPVPEPLDHRGLLTEYFSDIADTINTSFPNLTTLGLTVARFAPEDPSQPLRPELVSRHSAITSMETALKKVTIYWISYGGNFGPVKGNALAYALELACIAGYHCNYDIVPRPDGSSIMAVLRYIERCVLGAMHPHIVVC